MTFGVALAITIGIFWPLIILCLAVGISSSGKSKRRIRQ